MKLFWSCSLFSVLCTGVAFSATPTNGLVAYYPFTGNALDASGNGHDGTVFGAVLAPDRAGNPNSAYYFSGNTTYIEIPDHDQLDLTNNFTFCFWINLQQYSLTNSFLGPVVLCKHNVHDDRDGGWDIQVSYEHTMFMDDMYGGVRDVRIVPLSNWVFAALSYNDANGNWAWYINGTQTQAGVKQINIQNTTKNLLIGREGLRPTGNFFIGKIDDIRIYNRVLAPTEIQTLSRELPVPYELPFIAYLTFSDKTNGPGDVTDFYSDEIMYVTFKDVDMDARINQNQCRIILSQMSGKKYIVKYHDLTRMPNGEFKAAIPLKGFKGWVDISLIAGSGNQRMFRISRIRVY